MFSDCKAVTSVKLPDSIEFIEEAGFKSCINLQSLEIPKNCRFIGHQAFSAAWNLKSLKFAYGSVLESIGEEAFYDMRVLEEIVFPASLSIIEKYAFRSYVNNGKLQSVKFPANSTLSVIGEGAFQDQYNITTLELPKTLSEIGAYAFANLQNLSTLNLDNNVEVLETEVFANCARLTSLTLPKSLKKINSKAFKWLSYYTKLSVLTIPTPCTAIDFEAFSGSNVQDVYVSWANSEVPGAPWGLVNSNIHYNTITGNVSDTIYRVRGYAESTKILSGNSSEEILKPWTVEGVFNAGASFTDILSVNDTFVTGRAYTDINNEDDVV
jgi:hypothetical protein